MTGEPGQVYACSAKSVPCLGQSCRTGPTAGQTSQEKPIGIGKDTGRSIRESNLHSAQANPQFVGDDPGKGIMRGAHGAILVFFHKIHRSRGHPTRTQGKSGRSILIIRIRTRENGHGLTQIPIVRIKGESRRTDDLKIGIARNAESDLSRVGGLHGQPHSKRRSVSFRHPQGEYARIDCLNRGLPEIGNVGSGDGQDLCVVFRPCISRGHPKVGNLRVGKIGNLSWKVFRVVVVSHNGPVAGIFVLPPLSEAKGKQIVIFITIGRVIIFPIMQTAHIVSHLMGQSVTGRSDLIPYADTESGILKIKARRTHGIGQPTRITGGGKQGNQIGSIQITQTMNLIHVSVRGLLDPFQIGIQNPAWRISRLGLVNETQSQIQSAVQVAEVGIRHCPKNGRGQRGFTAGRGNDGGRIHHQQIDEIGISRSPGAGDLSGPPRIGRKRRAHPASSARKSPRR